MDAASSGLVTKGKTHLLRLLRLLSAPKELCWTHLRRCWRMALPREPSRVARPAEPALARLGSGSLTGRVWVEGLGHQKQRPLHPGPPFFFLTIFFVKGRAQSASLMGIKVLLLCNRLPL